MPAILWLLLAVVPTVGALSLDIDAFVPFFVLFCAIAGLMVSNADRQAGTSTDKGENGRRVRHGSFCEDRTGT